MYNHVFKFVSTQKEFLEKEKVSQENRQSSKSVHVKCQGVGNSTLGKYVIELKVVKGKVEILPLLKVGQVISIFELLNKDEKKTIRSEGGNSKILKSKGVIKRNIDRYSIEVIIDNDFDISRLNSEELFGLNIINDENTFKSYSYTLNKLAAIATKPLPCDNILQCAFGFREPSFNEKFQIKGFFNSNLNDTQKACVHFALSSNDICAILGPPGTGKTTTCCEIALQALLNEKMRSVLIVTPSNVAVDNIAEKIVNYMSILKKKNVSVIRIGHPARLKESVMKMSLDYQINKNLGKESKNLRREIEQNFKKMNKAKRFREKKGYKRTIYKIKKELKQYERTTTKGIVDDCNCVLATLTGCCSKVVKDKVYDLVIIDECAQSMEVSSWNAIVRSKSVILVGDFNQLPPTVLCQEVERELSYNLMKRLYEKYGKKFCKMLDIQYRMNEEIMEWSSEMFYENSLKCFGKIKEYILSDLEYVEEIEETITPLFFIDTSQVGYFEECEGDKEKAKGDKKLGGSKYNIGEIKCIQKYLKRITNAGVKEKDIGIISFYSAQVQRIKNEFHSTHPNIEIKTVDGFQGREKEVIILSMVRSNEKGEIGFLKDKRRINVAYTRAKRSVCIVGDSNTLKKGDKILASLVKYLNENADARFAEDYLIEDEE